MKRICPNCDRPFRSGELVTLKILAPYVELKSKVIYSVGQPLDADAESLQHADCGVYNEV